MAKAKKTLVLAEETVINRIYYLRSHKVMLDRDLAELYGVKPIRLREQVKRNPKKFPATYMFRLTVEETEAMVSQNAIPSRQQLGGYLPYAFTEHGVLMLANVLKSGTAIAVSLRLIEIFVKMREMLSVHKDVLLKLEQLEKRITGHDDEILMIFTALKELINPPVKPRLPIGFKLKGNKKKRNNE